MRRPPPPPATPRSFASQPPLARVLRPIRTAGTGRITRGGPVRSPHSLHDQRSLAIHRLVAERIRADPRVLDGPRQRVADWQRACTMNPKYPQAWNDLL